MATPPARHRTRNTQGSKTVGDYIDRHGLRPVAVYVPLPLHTAFARTAIAAESNLQQLLTLACNTFYGSRHDLPPLLAPTRTKLDPHKSVTWYADIDLHRRMKMLAVDLDGSVQQLILSAMVEYLKDAPEVKALGLETGFPAYARAPAVLPQAA